MKALHRGAAPASPAVARVAEQLLAAYPGRLQLLTGLRLVEADTGQTLALDLVAITDTAIVVGVETPGGEQGHATTPQAAALALARTQRERLGVAPLPVYAFWLGAAVPAGYTGGAPPLADAEAVRRFIEHASGQNTAPQAEAATKLAEALREGDFAATDGPHPPAPSPVGKSGQQGTPSAVLRGQAGSHNAPGPGMSPVDNSASDPPSAKLTIAAAPPPSKKQVGGGVLRRLRDLPGQLDAGLRERIRQPLTWRSEAARPADVQRRLEAAMFDPANLLEDARYSQVVPNEYHVELEADYYERHYRQIEQRLCEQWRVRLLEALDTANQRQGRRLYQFGGPVRVNLRPGAGLAPGAVRIRCAIVPETRRAPTPVGCLRQLPNGRQWPLLPGTLTLGRHETSDIYLESGSSRQAALISAHHAYLLVTESEVRLFDGSPAGRPSLNGTFVNRQRVPAGGHALAPGDVVVLAPLNPKDPRPEGPGVLALQFHKPCPHE